MSKKITLQVNEHIIEVGELTLEKLEEYNIFSFEEFSALQKVDKLSIIMMAVFDKYNIKCGDEFIIDLGK